MSKYIERKALIHSLKETADRLQELHDTTNEQDVRNSCYSQLIMLAECILRVKEQPATEIVRCKDCKHYKKLDSRYFERPEEAFSDCVCSHGIDLPEPDDFCSYGERKSGTEPQREND